MARNAVTPRGKFAVAEGLPELQKRISDILDRAVGQEIKKIWMRAAIVIRDQARANAAVLKVEQKGHVAGLLKRAIYAAYGSANKPDVLVGVAYGIAPHAHFVEYGTAERFTGDIKGKSTGKDKVSRGTMPAQPFMRPALLAKRAEATAIIAQGYRELIEKA